MCGSPSQEFPAESTSSSSYVPSTGISALDEGLVSINISNEIEPVIEIETIPSLCRSKDGSIKVQQFLARSRPEELDSLIAVIRLHLVELMQDTYGNYTAQTLFQSASPEQRLELLRSIEDHLVLIACDPKGTHSLQTLINLCSLPEEEEVYSKKLKGNIRELSFNLNGSHVVQKLLSTLRSRDFLIKELVGHARELATDKIGLCVVKKALNDPVMMNELLGDLLPMMQDPYGNYAVQNLVDRWSEEIAFPMIQAIKGRVSQLCIQKYSSNVMEKCIAEEEMRRFIANEIITHDKVAVLLESPYGCYVLRTLAMKLDYDLKENFRNMILSRKSTVSFKKLQTKLDEILFYLN